MPLSFRDTTIFLAALIAHLGPEVRRRRTVHEDRPPQGVVVLGPGRRGAGDTRVTRNLMAYRGTAVHRTIVLVDVEGFGDQRRNNPNQVAVRDGLYRSVQRAFRAAGIPWDRCYHEDRGDGVFLLAAPDVSKSLFVEALPRALADAVNDHNSAHPPEEQIRLRMALHAGEVKFDSHGATASSINHTFRLLEAPALKTALASSPGVLAVIVSSWFFDEVVRHSPVAHPATYREIDVTVKETTGLAWMCLPDHPFPPEHRPPPTRREPKVAVPQQLPARPGSFAGRARELAELTHLATTNPDAMAVVVIAGMGGIGKTWLTQQWAHENAHRFPDGLLYVNLRGFDNPVSPAAAARVFLDALQLPAGSIPNDPDAQAALYRGLVAGRRMLIVLDNAGDSGQVVPLLPASPTCTVLITSRRQLSGLVTAHEARPLAVGVLSDPEAHELLAKRIGTARLAAEPAAVSRLIGCCAGLPLALGIIAARAATQADLPLRELASELGETSTRLDVLDGGELTTNLRTVLSWSYDALDDEAAEVFRLLGLAPGPDIGLPAAAALTGLSESRVRVLLRQLENAHLVQRNHSSMRYRMHDLVRLYAADRAAADCAPGTDAVAVRRLITYYLHATHAGERLLYPDREPIDIGEPPQGQVPPAFGDDTSILTWFDAELACLLASHETARTHGWHHFVWQLAWTMHGYLWRRGHLQQQRTTWSAAVAAAAELCDSAMEGMAHRLLGQAYARAAMHTAASNHLHQALDLARESGDTQGEARAHHDLTLLWRQTDDRLALAHATRALRLFRTLGTPVWEAEALNMVGWHLAQLGRFREARSSCERALMLFRESKNRHGQAVTLTSLGYIAHRRGDHPRALTCFTESMELCRDLGATYYEAETLDHLGSVHAALGQHVKARRAWQRALDLHHAQHRTAEESRVRHRLEALTETCREPAALR